MDKQQLSHLIHIQQASRDNRLVVFVGAGVSRNSGIPTWNELINSMKLELPDELSDEPDVLKLAQLYKDSRGHKDYMDRIKEVLLYNKAVPNPLHKSILELNPCHIITTNYDNLIEQEIHNEFKQYAIVREDKDIPQMVHQNSLVKMHGDYLTDNIVLTETDYFNYSEKFPLVRAFIQSLFASKLVLFIGFSFVDLNLKMILNQLKNILSENMQRAYLLSCDKPNDLQKQYFSNKGINILYFDEKDVDKIIDSRYEYNILKNKGLQTDKILYAIKNYSKISKDDIADYLYMRIMPYTHELRSFGDGLKYFFPSNLKMTWNLHSSGLETFLPYFRNLAPKLKHPSDKRKFLLNHSNIDLRSLLKVAYYNYLEEIDGIVILDNKFYKNIDNYITPSIIDYLREFNYSKANERIKVLSSQAISYSIEDLEYPFALYAIGDYRLAYNQYIKLLPLYWDKQKYILYFICRYNLWSIRNGVRFQEIFSKTFDADKELQFADSSNLEDVLSKLPLDIEIKEMFHDLLSYRAIGRNLVKTEKNKEDIYQQRKSAEKGGCSINSNIQSLMATYYREKLFCHSNFIVCDNNEYFSSLCNNTALGILNSFATPESSMFGGQMQSTRIESLDNFMLDMLIFDVNKEYLESTLKGYEIKDLKFDETGINFINKSLQGLSGKDLMIFRSKERIYKPISNLFLLLSKSQAKDLDTETLYKVLIKFWNFEFNIGDKVISNLICQYPPQTTFVCTLISKILYESYVGSDYIQAIFQLANIAEKNNIEFEDVKIDLLTEKKDITLLILLYSICADSKKQTMLTYCLGKTDSLQDYLYFIYKNSINVASSTKLKELLEKEKKSINASHCNLLSKIVSDPQFSILHNDINIFAKKNNRLQFILSPFNYCYPNKVQIDWILGLDDKNKENLFKNDIYKKKLKEYIINNSMSKENIDFLLKFI